MVIACPLLDEVLHAFAVGAVGWTVTTLHISKAVVVVCFDAGTFYDCVLVVDTHLNVACTAFGT